MAIYRNVYTSFWTDPKVDDDFSPEDKYFYLYLLTNPHTNICGCYEISRKQIERETGYCHDTIIRLLKRLDVEHNVIRYNDITKEVLLLNWGRYNWTKSSKFLSAIKKDVLGIKDEQFRIYILNRVNNINNNIYTVTDTVTVTEKTIGYSQSEIGYGYPMDRVLNNEETDADFDGEKAWNDTFALYPKKSRADIAKQTWMQMMLDTVPQLRKQHAIELYCAIRDYLDDYKEKNKDDKSFRFIPKLEDWLKSDAEYWKEQYRKKELTDDE